MHLIRRYHWSKGVREYKVEEPPWAVWRSPATWRRMLRTTMGFMSRMIHLMHLGRRYHWSKGSRLREVEEPPLDSLAVTGNLEENASHHAIINDHPIIPKTWGTPSR